MDLDYKKSKVSMMRVKSTKSGTRSQVFNSHKSSSRMKVRKHSYGFGGVHGIKGMDTRMSQLAMEYKRPPIVYLNTYQLDPRVKFHAPAVVKVAEQVLDSLFTDHIYNIQDSPSVALRITGEILRSVKLLGFNRYRIITVVTVAQKRAQSYNNAVAFIWDQERDAVVNIDREVTTAFIQLMCWLYTNVKNNQKRNKASIYTVIKYVIRM